MKLLSIILFTILIGGCGGTSSEQTSLNGEKQNTIRPVDSINVATEIKESGKRQTGPTNKLLDFADSLHDWGWNPDTGRVSSVAIYPELKVATISWYRGRPYYQIEPTKSAMCRWKDSRNAEAIAINYNLFINARSVWAYFYKKDHTDEWKTDGVIEQWEFKNASEVKSAITNLKEVYPLPFFNTKPYYLQIDNYLYIFQTRAMTFSFDQKAIYKKFKLMKSAHHEI